MPLINKYRDYLEEEMLKTASEKIKIFSKNTRRLGNTSYYSIKNSNNQSEIINFDLNKIMVSGGSACSSGTLHQSRVLRAMQIKADFIINMLRKRNIECRPFFYPMHKQPVYKKMKIFNKKKYSNSERISEKGFYIPCGLGITIKEQNEVIKKIINLFQKIN